MQQELVLASGLPTVLLQASGGLFFHALFVRHLCFISQQRCVELKQRSKIPSSCVPEVFGALLSIRGRTGCGPRSVLCCAVSMFCL